ncbi:isochorismatase family cysteine hydrolase [Mesorhizobium sp. Z1-4]|uniref:cysteine hydrolase family protein n=1 Tax=Mesorhizobium sp. Z1-4 TaxID=2448478 RepID=UPI000FDA71B9|nr:isochorismatase family cysteine hydrolase [Mesorhizobium sp. Z1-4]
MVQFHIMPEKTALLGVDLQNCFVEGSPIAAPAGPQVVTSLNRLASKMRDAGCPIIWTRHVVRPDHANVGTLGMTVEPVQHGVIDENAPSSALSNRVDRHDTDILLLKPQFGAFYGTDLETILRSKGIDTVVIGGIATNFCCETTAREAHAREFKTIFLSDGTATFDMPDLGYGPVSAADAQRATLGALAFGFAEIASVDNVASRI